MFLLAFLPKPCMQYSSLPYVLHTMPISPLLLNHSNYIWRSVQYMKLLIMQFSPTYYFIIFGPNILLSTLFSSTFSLCPSLSVRNPSYIEMHTKLLFGRFEWRHLSADSELNA
jgi:hypothetical protein